MDVVDAQRDVVQPRAALVGVLRDRRVGRGRLEQLQPGVPDRQEMRADALRGDLFRRLDLEPQRVAIEGQRRRQILHRDTDVVEGGLHLIFSWFSCAFVFRAFRGCIYRLIARASRSAAAVYGSTSRDAMRSTIAPSSPAARTWRSR